MVSFHFYPLSNAYSTLAAVDISRAYLPGKWAKDFFINQDNGSWFSSADNYILAATFLPNDEPEHDHFLWKALENYLRAGGIPFGMIWELKEAAERADIACAPLADREQSTANIKALVMPLINPIGPPKSDQYRARALRAARFQAPNKLVLAALDLKGDKRGVVRPEKELRVLRKGLEDIKLGFAGIVERELAKVLIEDAETEPEVEEVGESRAGPSRRSEPKKCNLCSLVHDKAANSELKRCGQCRRVYYCTLAHQQEDWPQHKVVLFLLLERCILMVI
jgi:hypothetical protein